MTRDNRISSNLVELVGQDYYDAPGIFLGFTISSIVDHNHILNVPWSGIAMGWGWGMLDPGGFAGLPNAAPHQWGTYDTPSAAHGNSIVHNRIQYFLEKLWDGGAIYSQGAQGASLEDGALIAWNVAEQKRGAAGSNTFYTDGGSRFVTVRENVSLGNPVVFVDFGPCAKSSSLSEQDLCLLSGKVPYGADLGGCLPYGDLTFVRNYLRDHLTFYDICVNSSFPTYPVRMSFVGNAKITTADEVPAWILESAGPR